MCECWWMLTGVSPCCLADSPNKLWLLNTHKWMSSRSCELKHITTGSVHTSDLLWSASVCWSNILSWDSLLKSEQEPQIQLMILCDELLPPESHNTLSFHRLLIWKISTIAALTINQKEEINYEVRVVLAVHIEHVSHSNSTMCRSEINSKYWSSWLLEVDVLELQQNDFVHK